MGVLSFFTRMSWIKKSMLIVAAVFLIYSVFGFLILPSILETQLVAVVSKHFHRPASIDDIKVNPFALSVEVFGFALRGPDEERFAGFKRLLVDFRLSSIFLSTYTFDEIRLDEPDMRIQILPDKTFNFADLLSSSESPAAEKGQNEKRGMMPLRILRLRIYQGRIRFSDLSLPTPYKMEMFPIDISVDKFTTRKDAASPYTFTAASTQGGKIHWEGEVTLDPLRSKGHVALTDFNRRLLYEYLQDRVRFGMQRGTADLWSRYVLDASGDRIHFELLDANLQVRDFTLTEKGADQQLIFIPKLSVQQAGVDFTKKEAVIGSIASNGARIDGWLKADGKVNYQTLFAPAPRQGPDRETPPKGDPDEISRPWEVQVDEVKLNDYELSFEDRRPGKSVKFLLQPVDIHFKNLSNREHATLEIDLRARANQTGAISIRGSAEINPVLSADLDLEVDGLDLPLLQPYVDDFAKLDVVSGSAGLSGKIAYRGNNDERPTFRYTGAATVEEFETDSRLHHDDFLKWTSLSVNDITLEFSPFALHIGEIVAGQPYARVIIWPDRTVNIMNVFTSATAADDQAEAAPSTPKAKQEEAMPIAIDRVLIEHGSADFADQSLTPSFAAGIHEMNGSIMGLSSKSLARADVRIEGKVDRYAPVNIAGQINPLSVDKYTDLEVIFKNIELTTFTPYAGKFAGYMVEKGKLSLNLKYRLSKNMLIGENEIFLNQLTLGEHVDSPNATSLPVRLAVALLKDSRGNIEINLPVRGNLDDPEFSLGRIILKAFVNLITKIVTSPFTALGSIVGGSGEELSYIEFAFGRSELGSDQIDKLDKLSNALHERPELALEIKGTSDRHKDWQALAEAELLLSLKGLKINEMRATEQPLPKDIDAFALTDEDYRRLLRKAYKETINELSPENGGADAEKRHRETTANNSSDRSLSNKSATANAPEANADMSPEKIKQRLIDEMKVEEAKLRRLAVERAKRIFDYLAREGKISSDRLFIVEAAIIERADGDKIKTKLKLSGR
jgi:uncharacterized protein involved in outer membrane biogenesis